MLNCIIVNGVIFWITYYRKDIIITCSDIYKTRYLGYHKMEMLVFKALKCVAYNSIDIISNFLMIGVGFPKKIKRFHLRLLLRIVRSAEFGGIGEFVLPILASFINLRI